MGTWNGRHRRGCSRYRWRSIVLRCHRASCRSGCAVRRPRAWSSVGAALGWRRRSAAPGPSSRKGAPSGLAARSRRQRHETPTVPVCGCRAVRRIEQRESSPNTAPGSVTWANSISPLKMPTAPLFENQKPPGFRALGEHGLAGVKAGERKRGKLALPGLRIVDQSHVRAPPVVASTDAHRRTRRVG